METKCDIKKLHKPRIVDKETLKCSGTTGLPKSKTAETVPQNPTVTQPAALVAIPI